MGSATKNVRLIHEDKMIDVCLEYGITPKGAVMLPSMIEKIAKQMKMPVVTILDHAMTNKELGDLLPAFVREWQRNMKSRRKAHEGKDSNP